MKSLYCSLCYLLVRCHSVAVHSTRLMLFCYFVVMLYPCWWDTVGHDYLGLIQTLVVVLMLEQSCLFAYLAVVAEWRTASYASSRRPVPCLLFRPLSRVFRYIWPTCHSLFSVICRPFRPQRTCPGCMLPIWGSFVTPTVRSPRRVAFLQGLCMGPHLSSATLPHHHTTTPAHVASMSLHIHIRCRPCVVV